MSSSFSASHGLRVRAGNSGTETFIAGTSLIRIRATGAGGTVTMPKGDGKSTVTMTIDAFTGVLEEVNYDHLAFCFGGPGQPAAQLALVFTGTTSYQVTYACPPGGE